MTRSGGSSSVEMGVNLVTRNTMDCYAESEIAFEAASRGAAYCSVA